MRLKLTTRQEVEALLIVDAAHAPRPKCLLLHGNPGSIQDFAQLTPLLSTVADVAAIDLPGFGKSRRADLSAASLSLDKLAEHALAAADELGWNEPFFLVGHSHGGGVAQLAAARHPARVAGLFLLATLGATPHASYRLLALPGAAAITRLACSFFRARHLRSIKRRILRAVMADIFSPEPVPGPKLEQELDSFAAHPEILLSMAQVALGQPCAALLASAHQIRCPTVFVHGAADALVPAACAELIHQRLLETGGRSEFHTLTGAGHMLLDYQAQAVANLIISHIVGQVGATS